MNQGLLLDFFVFLVHRFLAQILLMEVVLRNFSADLVCRPFLGGRVVERETHLIARDVVRATRSNHLTAVQRTFRVAADYATLLALE